MHGRDTPGEALAEAGLSASTLRAAVAAMLDRQWVGAGYAAPNERVYPWQWLWDSCFHVVVWAELGRADRALEELGQVLHSQDELGFVPHMNYQLDPSAHAELWGRSGSSSITQPPMYGHAIAELARRGIDVPAELIERAGRGVRFLLGHRPRHRSGLVAVCHPWETGADDSPRWDDACPSGFAIERWRAHKDHLVATIERSAVGSPLTNPAFDVASIGFTALVAFNAAELADTIGDSDLARDAAALVEALVTRWDPTRQTWVDAGSTESGSGRARTLDGLLPLLVVDEPSQLDPAFAALVDPAAHGAACGPRGVHLDEPSYTPRTYWRGPAWPQLSYLLWIAARRAGRAEVAASLAASTMRGAARSGLAEYWDADDGTGLGAIPQSWAGLAITMAP